MATSKEISADRLILLRAQNSGTMKVTVTVSNGGEESISSTSITVREPLKDEWVELKGEKDEKPENNQFYARNDKNEGTLYYNGTLDKVADSVFLKIFADGQLFHKAIQKLSVDRIYRFSAKLQSGLIKYRVEFGSKSGNLETVTDTIGNIVCGDAYIIDGQSNAEANDFGKAVNPFTSDWIRSFGSADSDPDRAHLRKWGNAVSYDNHGAKFQIGYWAVELARQLLENHKIPVCIINGTVGGSRIDTHQRNDTDPQDINSIYGRLLWRVQQAGLTHGIRGILWHQGENDQGADGPTGAYGWETYRQYFIDMAGAWKQDYPNIQYYYIFQIWPKSCSMGINGSDNMLREVQRTLPGYFSNMSIMSTLGIKPAGTCHFPPEGYAEISHRIAPVVERDNYGKVYNRPVTPPNLKKVYFTTAKKDEICLIFDQQIKWDNNLITQFYLNGESGWIASGSVSGKEIRIKLSKPSVAKTITYLDSKSWSQENLLYGENGIAALTFCNVPILDQRNDTTGIVIQKIPAKVVVLTFDDAGESHGSFVGPLLKKLGFGGSFYITEFEKTFSDKTQYMTWKQIKSLDALDLEVGNHTLLHRGEKSPEEFTLQTAAIEEHCLSNHIPKPNTFCWPFYQVQEREYPTLYKRGYLFARGGHERVYKPTIDNPFDVPSFSISNDYFEKDKDLFYKAVKQATAGQIVVLTFHGVPDLEHPFAGTEQKQFLEYMKYLKDNHYTVLSLRDLIRYINPEMAAKQLIN
jgi:peptidoglycan/xylan/chitin deacetylase (PgdA/CDA1 family)